MSGRMRITSVTASVGGRSVIMCSASGGRCGAIATTVNYYKIDKHADIVGCDECIRRVRDLVRDRSVYTYDFYQPLLQPALAPEADIIAAEIAILALERLLHRSPADVALLRAAGEEARGRYFEACRLCVQGTTYWTSGTGPCDCCHGTGLVLRDDARLLFAAEARAA